jgi:hypothetical protein
MLNRIGKYLLSFAVLTTVVFTALAIVLGAINYITILIKKL